MSNLEKYRAGGAWTARTYTSGPPDETILKGPRPDSTIITGADVGGQGNIVKNTPGNGDWYADPGAGKMYIGASTGQIAEKFGSGNFLYHGQQLAPYNNNVAPVLQAQRLYMGTTGAQAPFWTSGESTEVNNIVSGGRIPVVSTKFAAEVSAVTSGSRDQKIKDMSSFIRGLTYQGNQVPFVWTPHHEMTPGEIPIASYINYVRYVVDRLRGRVAGFVNTPNLLVAFCPTAYSTNLKNDHADYGFQFYAGDNYFDFCGADGYNYYTDMLAAPTEDLNKKYRDFRCIFQNTANFAAGIHPYGPTVGRANGVQRPWLVGESGSHEIHPSSYPSRLSNQWHDTPTNDTASNYYNRYDTDGFKNLQVYSTNANTVMREWYTGPGGFPWLAANGCKMFMYWPSGGTSANTDFPEWDIGTQHWTWDGSEKYAGTADDLRNLPAPQSVRAQSFVNMLNAYNASWVANV